MGQYFLHPDYLKIVNEYMDYTDKETRQTLLNINEADQNKVLLGLTGRLYEIISDKASEVNFGDIPKTKGDVTKLPNYDKLEESITLLQKICAEYKQPTKDNIDVVANALENLKTRKDVFERAFKLNIDMPILLYNTIYLSIINATSLMICACIEYIKTPAEETYEIALDKVAVVKTQQNMLFENLKKFNSSCLKGEVDSVLNFVMKQNVKNFSGIDDFMIFGGGAILIALVFNIIPIIRELIFFFYYSRVKMSDFFDVQADLLIMNTQNLEYNTIKTPAEKKKIKEKQLKIAGKFRQIANIIAVDAKQSEVKASRDVEETNSKRAKIKDIGDGSYDSANASEVKTSSLF